MSDQPADDRNTEIREVRVSDPQLSAETNERLTREAQSVLGQTSVRVPADRQHPDEGDRPKSAGPILNVTGMRLMFIIVASAFVIVALIALLSGASWWFLPVAFLALMAALGWIVRTVLQMTTIQEHASATTTAAMQADGVRNPDEYFSAVVNEFSAEVDDSGSEHRTVSAAEDPAKANAEHQRATTPTSGPSEAVGP